MELQAILANWTDLPWQNWGLAGAVICAQFAVIWRYRGDVMGLASRVQKMAEEHAQRMERLTDSCLESIKENTKVTVALNEFLRANGHQPKEESK